MATYDLSWPAQVTDQVKDLIVTSFVLTETSSHGNIRLVFALSRSPHVKDLVINSFGPTVTFLHVNMGILMVRPRNRLKLLARFISPSLIDFQSPSHTPSATPSTGLRPVLRASLLKGPRSHTSSNRLLVSD
jgi:hypothetical protein